MPDNELPARFLSILGFAAKARKLISGETGCLSSLSKRKGFLLIISSDASDNSKERFYRAARNTGIKVLEIGSKAELGCAIGRGDRAIILVLDNNFAKTLVEAIGERSNM